jgi:hypothetical protein
MKGSHRITRLVTAGLIAGAFAAPAASARPLAEPSVAYDSEPVVIEPDRAPVVQSVDEGFDWASAAIGAGVAGSGLVLLVGVGSSHRRRHEHLDVAR